MSVFSGIYTTESVLDNIYQNPKECHFEVPSDSINTETIALADKKNGLKVETSFEQA